MSRTKPPYPPEFRREAVELVRVSGEPIAQVASDLASPISPCATGSTPGLRTKLRI